MVVNIFFYKFDSFVWEIDVEKITNRYIHEIIPQKVIFSNIFPNYIVQRHSSPV